MSWLRMITGIWKSREETGEKVQDLNLRTRYYKESQDRMVQKVLDVLEKELPGWKVVHVDKSRGEVMVEKREFYGINDITISVYSISPVQSAIDVVSAKRGSLGDLGSTYRNIVDFFTALHKEIKPESK